MWPILLVLTVLFIYEVHIRERVWNICDEDNYAKKLEDQDNNTLYLSYGGIEFSKFSARFFCAQKFGEIINIYSEEYFLDILEMLRHEVKYETLELWMNFTTFPNKSLINSKSSKFDDIGPNGEEIYVFEFPIIKYAKRVPEFDTREFNNSPISKMGNLQFSVTNNDQGLCSYLYFNLNDSKFFSKIDIHLNVSCYSRICGVLCSKNYSEMDDSD